MDKQSIKLMMTKDEIDAYFNKNIKKIKKAIKHIKFNKRPITEWESDEMISYTYEHLLKHQGSLNEEKIESYIINYITKNIVWENSFINKKTPMSKRIDSSASPTDVDITDEEDREDLNDKINHEKKMVEYQQLKYQFRETLEQYRKVLFDAIFFEKCYMIKELQQRFNISRTYLTKQRLELFQDFKEFAKNKREA
jgi:hypothetical protein